MQRGPIGFRDFGGRQGQHGPTRSLQPQGVSKPRRLGPERQRVGQSQKLTERLERGCRLQRNQELLAVGAWQSAMNDLDVETGEPRDRPRRSER